MKGSIIASGVFDFSFLLSRGGVVDSKILSKNKVRVPYLRRKKGKEQKRVRSKRTLR